MAAAWTAWPATAHPATPQPPAHHHHPSPKNTTQKPGSVNGETREPALPAFSPHHSPRPAHSRPPSGQTAGSWRGSSTGVIALFDLFPRQFPSPPPPLEYRPAGSGGWWCLWCWRDGRHCGYDHCRCCWWRWWWAGRSCGARRSSFSFSAWCAVKTVAPGRLRWTRWRARPRRRYYCCGAPSPLMRSHFETLRPFSCRWRRWRWWNRIPWWNCGDFPMTWCVAGWIPSEFPTRKSSRGFPAGKEIWLNDDLIKTQSYWLDCLAKLTIDWLLDWLHRRPVQLIACPSDRLIWFDWLIHEWIFRLFRLDRPEIFATKTTFPTIILQKKWRSSRSLKLDEINCQSADFKRDIQKANNTNLLPMIPPINYQL